MEKTMNRIVSYSLFVRRYNTRQSFDSLEELKHEVSRYFLAREKYIVDRLTDFRYAKFNEYGYAKNSYQDFEVYAYLEV